MGSYDACLMLSNGPDYIATVHGGRQVRFIKTFSGQPVCSVLLDHGRR